MCKLNQNLSRKLNRFKRKFKSYKCINYLIKVTRKFQSNIHIKYVSYTIIAFIIAFIFLYPSKEVIVNNETMFKTVLGYKFKDHNALVAAIIGILAFFATIYSVDMNYKSTKLSSLPDNAVDLLIDLEYLFNEFKIDKENNKEDVIIFFMDILKFWKNHQKAFRLLSPKFYKKFLKLYSTPFKIEGNDAAQINSEYIIKAMRTQIMDVALGNNEAKFYFIKPSIFRNDINILDIRDSKENYDYYEMSKLGLKSYIGQLNGETHMLTAEKFDDFCFDLEKLLFDLKEEISNYDLL